jgi:hypothetical protein
MRARLLDAAKTLARRWPTVAAVVHRELDAVVQALRDPRLDKLARLIDDGRLAEARALLAALSEDLEPGHPDLVGAVWEFNMAEQAARKAAPVAVEAPASPIGGAGTTWDDNPPDDCEAPESHPECPCVRPEEEPSKPSRILPTQVWRCEGVEQALEVWPRDSITGPGDVALFPVFSGGTYGRTRAREVDMLGLKEWSFVRGPR